MPTTVPITNANGTVWSFASTDTPSNTALGARMYALAFLSEGSSTSFAMCRPGVFAGPGLTAANTPVAFFVSPTGSGLGVQVAAGAAAVERGTFSGPTWSTFTPAGTYPYPFVMKSIATFTANTANSLSSTRIDRVDLQLADGPGYSDNSGTSFGQIIYTAGTVGSGSAPNAPANSIPLSLITFPSGTTSTLTSGMFADLRRSTSVRGSARVLMGGDSLADPGFVAGEDRWRYHATYGWMNDVWDATNSVWRGTQVLELAQPAMSTPGLPSSSVATIASLAIPDPGWPYHVESGASQYCQQTSGGAAGSVLLQINVQMDSATLGTNIITSGSFGNYSSSTSLGQGCVAINKSSKTIQPGGYTGAHTIYMIGTAVGGNISLVSAAMNAFQIKLVPA